MQRVAFLQVDPAHALPIWRQIEEGMARLVASRALRPGVAVPSVRELARELCVNPATVAKAYGRLVDAGVFEVRRGEGTFVCETPPAVEPGERRRALAEPATRLAVVARTLGARRAEATRALEAAFDGLDGRAGGEDA